MSEDIRRKYTPEQTAKLREETVARIARSVGQVFEKHPELRSALMLVAQYWDDESDDAVHFSTIFSKLTVPKLDAATQEWTEDEYRDSINLPEGLYHMDLELELYLEGYDWNCTGDAIPLFAAFTKEGSHQNMPPTESGTPYAVFRRSPTGVEMELVGEMWRPWLDGVMPEWEQGIIR